MKFHFISQGPEEAEIKMKGWLIRKGLEEAEERTENRRSGGKDGEQKKRREKIRSIIK